MVDHIYPLVPPVTELPAGRTASRTVTAGANVTLSAFISGFNLPLTSISWRHQDDVLTGSEDRVIITTTPMLSVATGSVLSTLQLLATVPRDSGRYVITAANDAGQGVLEFTVNVTGRSTSLFNSTVDIVLVYVGGQRKSRGPDFRSVVLRGPDLRSDVVVLEFHLCTVEPLMF